MIVSEDKSQGGAPAAEIDLSKYTLSNPAEVAQHLRVIIQHGQMVTVFSNKGKSFILTRILALDPQAKTMVLDWGANEAANRILLQSERNIFVCSPAGVKTQFVTGAPRRIEYEGETAFEVELPAQLIKLQRREFFRIPTPIANPLICTLPDHPDGPQQFPLSDISIGGAALAVTTAQASLLQPGDMHVATIELKPFGTLQVQLEIRHLMKIQHKNGLEMLRVGCYFSNMNTARETLVQRYVANLERERRALVR